MLVNISGRFFNFFLGGGGEGQGLLYATKVGYLKLHLCTS